MIIIINTVNYDPEYILHAVIINIHWPPNDGGNMVTLSSLLVKVGR